MQAQQIHVAQNSQMESAAARQTKSAVSTFHVFLVFFSLLFANLLRSGCQLSVISPQSSALTDLLLYAGTLTFLNWSLNPVIYCWKMRHIRHAIIDTLRHIFPSQN